ncbi:MAG: helix-turn-helix domain-containing protein [SAR86 cluster bacterium]|uniref:Helix-turn-helix transcriptional regulator n=1 Tax=SAR86 cluster bacterium TaxID=2030880 RepID=A0A972VZ54_9GAMM|nr:helix-turn-helix transcriptional regulator [SAR86 cluster bacterium]
MKTYGQFCPLAQATQLLCERWTLLVVRELVAGSTRFSDLKRGVPLMSPTLLSSRLKHLVKSGVVERSGDKGNQRYRLSEAGNELRPIIELLGVWGHRWAQSDLNAGDLDAGLLMWDMRRSVDSSIFPSQRVVVQFAYPDAPSGARDWWLISENGEVDLCLKDPGFEVDILLKSSLKAMTEVWICKKTFKVAKANGDVQITGNPKLVAKFQEWLRTSALSRLDSLAADGVA